MGIIFGLLLIVMGALLARDFLGQKVPAARQPLDQMNAYSGFVGVGALLIGFIWFLQALSMLAYFGEHPLLVVKVLVSSLSCLFFGLLLGLPLLHKLMNEPTPGFLLMADKWNAALQPHRTNAGLFLIALGVITIL